MLRIDRVLGSRLESEYSEEIHRLEHRGAVDLVNIPVADLARRRLLATTRAGEELAIALPRHQKLVDGALLVIDGDRAIVGRLAASPEAVRRLPPVDRWRARGRRSRGHRARDPPRAALDKRRHRTG